MKVISKVFCKKVNYGKEIFPNIFIRVGHENGYINYIFPLLSNNTYYKKFGKRGIMPIRKELQSEGYWCMIFYVMLDR